MMKYIKLWNKEFADFFKENLNISIIYFVLLPVLSYSWINSNTSRPGTDIFGKCFADFFVVSQNAYFFYFVVVIMANLLFVMMSRNDFKINIIVRQKSASQLWLKQSYFSLLISIVISIYKLIIVAVIGCFKYNVPINFDRKQSHFGLANQGLVTDTMTTLTVVLTSFAFSFLAILTMNLLFQLLNWLFNHKIICFICVFILGTMDWSGYGLNSIASASYENLLNYRPITLLVPMIFAILLFVIGVYFSKKKEFLNAK